MAVAWRSGQSSTSFVGASRRTVAVKSRDVGAFLGFEPPPRNTRKGIPTPRARKEEDGLLQRDRASDRPFCSQGLSASGLPSACWLCFSCSLRRFVSRGTGPRGAVAGGRARRRRSRAPFSAIGDGAEDELLIFTQHGHPVIHAFGVGLVAPMIEQGCGVLQRTTAFLLMNFQGE